MDNALAVRDDFKITADDVRKYFAPNATEKEFGILMGICNSFKLNPFKREVHFVKYGNAPASVITGYEIYLKRAERTGKLDGWKCWIEKDDIGEKAVVEIHRKDQSVPFRWEAYRKEFDKGQSTWKSMPTMMLKKVAISQGFRLCFSEELGGLPYTAEEMPHDKGGGTSEALPAVEVVDAVTETPAPVSPVPLISTSAENAVPAEIEFISKAQQVRLFTIATKNKWPTDELKAYLEGEHGITSTKEIPVGVYDKIIAYVESHTGYGNEAA